MTAIETVEASRGQAHEIIAIAQYERITEAASLMYENRVGSLVVIASDDDETMVGIITERDILGWISNASPETYFQQVREVMTSDVVFCEPGASISDSFKQMEQHRIRHMPIVERGKAVGMLSVRDLLERHVQSASERL